MMAKYGGVNCSTIILYCTALCIHGTYDIIILSVYPFVRLMDRVKMAEHR